MLQNFSRVCRLQRCGVIVPSNNVAICRHGRCLIGSMLRATVYGRSVPGSHVISLSYHPYKNVSQLVNFSLYKTSKPVLFYKDQCQGKMCHISPDTRGNVASSADISNYSGIIRSRSKRAAKPRAEGPRHEMGPGKRQIRRSLSLEMFKLSFDSVSIQCLLTL